MAETAKAKAEREKVQAERDFYRQKARKATVDAELAEIELHRFRCSQDATRLYNFIGAVTGGSAQTCINVIGQWFREDPDTPITIEFNSPGGGVFPGLALYDCITELQDRGATINTKSVGMAASMAGILLQAGTKRTIGRNAYLMIHEISSGAIGNVSELEDEVAFAKRLQNRALDILASRSTMSRAQIARKWKRKDWWLDAEEAVSLGFADEIC